MKRTKIVATLGPASSSKEVLKGMIQAGANIFRLNFSHSSHEEHLKVIETIHETERRIEYPYLVFWPIFKDLKFELVKLRTMVSN